jgi:lycopene cyclase domain-containing protein
MTYFSFLLLFLVVPIGLLLILTVRDRQRGKITLGFLDGRSVWVAIGLHVLLAIVYTTPWDNYLVATRVWYYNPDLISGVVLGWVPLEEYIFFVLETVLVGLWWLLLVRRVKPSGEFRPRRKIGIVSTAILAAVWLLTVGVLISGWKSATYISLILVWALPAILLQLAFGADILWHFRKIVIFVILPVFLYVSIADALAISSGTWTIDPDQSLRIWIWALPVEEATFFLVTAMIIGFGLTLSLARASRERWLVWADRLFGIHLRISSLKSPVEE